MVAISPQNVEKSAEIRTQHGLEFPILSDVGNAYAKRLSITFSLPDDLRQAYEGFGVMLPEFNGDDSWSLPMPTRIVVDRDGVIRSIESETDYTNRVEPAATVSDLEEKIAETGKRLLKTLRTELEAERRRSHELLLNILPAPIAAELKRKGRVEPVHVEAATVLFSDFKGFTHAASQMSADEVVKNLGECFTAFDEIVAKHDLEKLKTLGDGYMCAGGLLGDAKDHSCRMVHAAFDMRDWIEAWGRRRIEQGKEAWSIRIGIHRGPLVAGVIGSHKFAYDIWGDTVNVASRLESGGEAGKVNVSREVVDALEEDCRVEPRGRVVAKNRGEIEMFFVERAE